MVSRAEDLEKIYMARAGLRECETEVEHEWDDNTNDFIVRIVLRDNANRTKRGMYVRLPEELFKIVKEGERMPEYSLEEE